MSRLLDRSGAVADAWTRAEDLDTLERVDGPALVPLALAGDALDRRRNAPLGLELANRTPLDAVEPFLSSVELLAIAFPAFSDGTGLSLARRLRRSGYRGRLRAVGPLISDQFAEALSCGFDEIELPDASADRQPEGQWLAALEAITAHYQTGYGETRSILEQRRGAAEAQAR